MLAIVGAEEECAALISFSFKENHQFVKSRGNSGVEEEDRQSSRAATRVRQRGCVRPNRRQGAAGARE
jgi:hypothetical protein